MIWFDKYTIEQLRQFKVEDMNAHIGIEFTEIGEDYLAAKMPVDHRTRQPFGI